MSSYTLGISWPSYIKIQQRQTFLRNRWTYKSWFLYFQLKYLYSRVANFKSVSTWSGFHSAHKFPWPISTDNTSHTGCTPLKLAK